MKTSNSRTQKAFEMMHKALVLISEAKPAVKRLTDEQLAAYWMVLGEKILTEPEMFQAAIMEILRDSKDWMPSAGEIFSKMQRLNVKRNPSAEEAWRTAERHALAGARDSIGNALIDYAARIVGGYGAIASCDLEREAFQRRDFIAAYNNGIEKDQIGQLAGDTMRAFGTTGKLMDLIPEGQKKTFRELVEIEKRKILSGE